MLTLTGSAVIIENPTVEVSVTIVSNANMVCPGTMVTMTPDPAGGGTNPGYQWFMNTVAVSTDSVYSFIPLNGDVVYVVLTSDAPCTSGNPAISNEITMIVNPAITSEVSIEVDQNNVCEDTPVSFTAIPINGGDTPVYQWFVNNIESSENSPSFNYVPMNNDTVYVQMTSSLECVVTNPVQSNSIQVVVIDFVNADVSIVADQNNVCEGTQVTFTATPVNCGDTPVYQWFVNNIESGENSSTFTYSPTNNDTVSVLLTSSLPCVANNPVVSNTIQMQVIDMVEVTATIDVIENNLCEGSEMTFFATTSGGGTEPSYEWLVNGTSAGTNAESFIFTPENGDAVSLVFTSSETCTIQNPVESNTITAIVNPTPEISWNYTDPTTVCIEDWGPITLSGGLPEGGIYSGDGVTGNIFDQAVASVGNHVISYTYTDANYCSNQASIEFTVDACLGVTESANGLLVYPNPANDNFTIKLNNQNIIGVNLFNSMGISVYDKLNVKTANMTVPVKNLPSGNYILKVITDHETIVKTVIIK